MALNDFEKSCLQGQVDGQPVLREEESRFEQWLRVGLWSMIEIGARVRRARIHISELSNALKSDGTPVTDFERRLEDFTRKSLQRHLPHVVFIGEESAAGTPGPGITASMDPIDGTWAFLSHAESCASTLAFFENGIPCVGLVLNPATGEIGYSAPEVPSRLLQMGMFGAEDEAIDLPTRQVLPEPKHLVHVHPSRNSFKLMRHFYRQWNDGHIRQVKSSGGSPAWAMLESAKGHYVYVNLWSRGPTQSFDLAAGVLLVRGAGGDVVDEQGNPIDPMNHEGPFVSGIDAEVRARALEALSDYRDAEKSTESGMSV